MKRCRTCHFAPCRCEDLRNPVDVTDSAKGQWPKTSTALTVHPDQIEEALVRNKSRGSSVTYERDGTAIIPDKTEFRRIMKIEGMYDKDSFI